MHEGDRGMELGETGSEDAVDSSVLAAVDVVATPSRIV